MSHKKSSVIADMVKVEDNFSDSNDTEVNFKSIQSDIKLETEDEILLNIKQEKIDIKDEVPSTSTFQNYGNQDVDGSVPSTSFQKSNHKDRGIEDDFKHIGSSIKPEIEDEILLDIKQEELDIKDEVSSTSTFHSDGEQDVDDNAPSISFEKSNRRRGRIEDDFRSIGSDIKQDTKDATLMDIKQEEIDIKDEIPSTSTFHSDGEQDVDDNAPSVSFQKLNKKFMSSHKTHREKLFVCYVCDFKSAWKESLTRHIKSHTEEQPFAYSLCDYKCTQKHSLISHMKIRAGVKPFTCSLCDFKSAGKTNLTIHMRSHTGEKPFTCSLCDYKCTQKHSLISHMKIHTGVKPFTCSLCDFKSIWKESLTRHMKSHTGEKPFVCGLCEFKSAWKKSLTSHMKRHSGVKPFTCNLCDYKSAQKHSSTIHMRRHTGEKPFACCLCDFKSASKSYLKSHMKRHTKHR